MLKRVLKISRPRFWMYFIGPYLIGIGASMPFNDALAGNMDVLWWLLFFTLPANFFVYGINDLADEDTDKFNQKKGTYEVKLVTSDKKIVIWGSILLSLPFIPLFIYSSMGEQIALVIFIIFGYIYSFPPLRLKARPFIDSLSNGVLYTMAGFIGYYAAGGEGISWLPYLGGALWASVMHLYSAIPDIEADTKAGIKTTATVLGAKWSLVVCFISYLVIGAMVFAAGYHWMSLLVIPYLVLIFLSFRSLKNDSGVFGIYKAYPYVTYVIGASVYAFIVNNIL